MSKAHKPQKQPWVTKGHIEDVALRWATAPDELKRLFLRVNEEMCDLGEEHNVPPKTMAALAASMIGTLAMVEVLGEAHDDVAIDDFLEYCHRAMHIAVANARIKHGWTPPQ